MFSLGGSLALAPASPSPSDVRPRSPAVHESLVHFTGLSPGHSTQGSSMSLLRDRCGIRGPEARQGVNATGFALSYARAQGPPLRHGLLLRGRAYAGRPVPARQAGGDRRPAGEPGSGGGRELRGPALRRPFGDALLARPAALPGRHLHPARLPPLLQGVGEDLRHLPGAHPAGAGGVDRRGLPRRHRPPGRGGERDGAGQGDPAAGARGAGADGEHRRRAQPADRQDRLGLRQAGRPDRGAAGEGAGVPRSAAGAAAPRRGTRRPRGRSPR